MLVQEPVGAASGGDVDMAAPPAAATPATGGEAAAGAAAAAPVAETAASRKRAALVEAAAPEISAYLSLLVLSRLLRVGGAACAGEAAARLGGAWQRANRRTLDVFVAKAFALACLGAERAAGAAGGAGALGEVRGALMAAHRTAVLQHDEVSTATLVNLLLRGYIEQGMYDQAYLLRQHTKARPAHRGPPPPPLLTVARAQDKFPAAASNAQLVRNHYYVGRIAAMQLDYSEAHVNLQTALRKAPRNTAHGFRATVGARARYHAHARPRPHTDARAGAEARYSGSAAAG